MNSSLIPKRIDSSLVSRKVDNELLIVDQDKGKIHQLNLSAEFVWGQCDGMNSIEEIVIKTLEKFDIDEDQLKKDVDNILESLIELNLIELVEH